MKHDRDTYALDGRDERRDCAVRAFSVAACVSYDSAHALFEKFGRRDRHATSLAMSVSVLRDQFPAAQRITFRTCTVGAFLKNHIDGHYIVFVRNHCFAVCDGIIFDWKPALKRIVKSAWKLC